MSSCHRRIELARLTDVDFSIQRTHPKANSETSEREPTVILGWTVSATIKIGNQEEVAIQASISDYDQGITDISIQSELLNQTGMGEMIITWTTQSQKKKTTIIDITVK